MASRTAPTATLMDIDRLISELALVEGLAAAVLPHKQLRWASDNRDCVIPAFLDELRLYLDRKTPATDPSAVFFIFHLLGFWKERRAYRLLARLLRLSPERLHSVLGDAVPVTSHRVMMNVFDGDPEPLYEIILDPKADGIVRSRMLETLAILTFQDKIPREETTAFLRDCFSNLQPQTACVAWVGWQSAISMLGLSEIKLLVKQAFERGSIDSSVVTYKHFNDDLQRAIEGNSAAASDEYKPFGNPVQELSGWSNYW